MQLVQFGQSAEIVCSETKFGRSVRLMNAKEFKAARGLRGQEAKRAYNAYIREHGTANTGALAGAMARGELLVKGFKDGKNTLSVSFVKRASLKDPEKKEEVTTDEALAALGLSAEDLALLAQLKKN